MEPEFVTANGWKFFMITTITKKSTWGDAKFESPNGQTGGIYWESITNDECFLNASFEKEGNLYSWQVNHAPQSEAELFSLFETVWVPHLESMGLD